jgi:hypothetical protein
MGNKNPAETGLNFHYDNWELPSLSPVPIVEIASCAVFLDPIPFLYLAFELVSIAGNLIEIIVSELSPLFLDLSFYLFPVTFDTVPIHGASS